MTDIETRLDVKDKAKLVKTWSDKGYKVIVNIHFGVEYQKKHSSYQELIAHTMVDNGASLIIGHHPHTVEDSEVYKKVPIFYSL